MYPYLQVRNLNFTEKNLQVFRDRRKWNVNGDCERILDKVKACDMALIKKMNMSELSRVYSFS